MNIYFAKDYNALSLRAANIIIEQIKAKPDCVLGLATGSTPVGVYKLLAKACERGEISFAGVKTVNLDEYVGLAPDDPNSYRRFMDEHLFKHIDIDPANTHVPHGNAVDIAAECARYDALIESLGGIDLQLLGIGRNGHIGFNEPDTEFHVGTHEVILSESTRKANGIYFSSPELIPRSALTLGMGAIMKARKVLLIASGESKRDSLEKAVYGEATPEVPASALLLHPATTVICDFDIK